ncbi:hypothetical protein MCHIJ_29680 [Mycolicibacterium chitae]|uniref:Protein of uncharacterized function (DUF1707) n=1 Tax=Mycolicibacterium chitae TaxID=1792 RepID=A0A3S5EI91_MYCCI|nr:DUF1707 domain-containing protein [Mycolicibacterium chitae]MCV7108715.1 DUF1707 domain-containing protein [Mycolicibacterium chitae]BBZ03531.1 hypothetical protein MCHIJ_29680 [Mycolicibacterium chitae]VEG47162.1 protein of uncharacterised function (DUF1707) [Mycolicibacterium chitae]
MTHSAVEHPLRAGDRERERCTALLGQAMSQGYLSLPEYEQRVAQAFTAETADELRRLVADLPVPLITRNDPRVRHRRRAAARRGVTWHLAAYATMVAICLSVWLAVGLTAGAWYFWPIWPMLGGAIGVVSHALPVRLCAR